MACIYLLLPSLARHTQMIWLECGRGLRPSSALRSYLGDESSSPHIFRAVVLNIWQMSEDIFRCHNRGGHGTGIQRVEAKDAANILQCTGRAPARCILQPTASAERSSQPLMLIIFTINNINDVLSCVPRDT